MVDAVKTICRFGGERAGDAAAIQTLLLARNMSAVGGINTGHTRAVLTTRAASIWAMCVFKAGHALKIFKRAGIPANIAVATIVVGQTSYARIGRDIANRIGAAVRVRKAAVTGERVAITA